MNIFFLNALIVIFSIFLSFISQQIDRILGLQGYQSNYSMILGLAFIMGGLIFRIVASLQFYKNKINILTLKAQQILITDGLYSYSRNPLYIGIILILFGCILYVGTVSGLAILLVSFLFCNWWIRNKEEVYMEKAFGEVYKKYKKKVQRWI